MGTSSRMSPHTQSLRMMEHQGTHGELTTRPRDAVKMSRPSEHACLIVPGHPIRTGTSILMTQL